jgi:hypothetical protein
MNAQSSPNAKHLQFDPSTLERSEPSMPERGLLEGANEDPTTDPEGAERRADPEAGNDYPSFVLEDYEMSDRMSNGRKWDDGRKHLIPKQITLRRVYDLHESGMKPETFLEMKRRAHREQEQLVTQYLTGYRHIVDNDDPREVFEVMRSIGDICNRALADRAVRKHQFISMSDRMKMNDDGSMPESLEKAETSMRIASEKAGVWTLVHNTLWKELGWKGEPRYYANYAIDVKLRDLAKYFEDNFRRTSSVERAQLSDYAAQALLY